MTTTLEAQPRFRASKKRGSLPPLQPPSLRNTTLPDGIAAHDPAAAGSTTPNGQPPPFARGISSRIQTIPLVDLSPHPFNRRPRQAQVAALAASLQERGQLEPLLIREADGLGLSFEIVSGETRFLAARQLGWSGLACRIVPCNPAEALQLLAACNAERADLSPIDQARLIVRLCAPAAAGGSGLTRAAAARTIRLESAGAASNLVRLLELPQVWQERVASGELPQTFAREILPALKSPRAMQRIAASYTAARGERGPAAQKKAWQSRDGVHGLVQSLTKPKRSRAPGSMPEPSPHTCVCRHCGRSMSVMATGRPAQRPKAAARKRGQP